MVVISPLSPGWRLTCWVGDFAIQQILTTLVVYKSGMLELEEIPRDYLV